MKNSIFRILIAVFSVMLLVFAGCDNGTKSSNAELDSVTIGSINRVQRQLGMPVEKWSDISEDSIGYVDLPITDATDTVNVSAVKSHTGASVEYGKTSKGGSEPAAYSATGSFALDNGDWLVIKVTAENGNVLIYILEISMGTNSSMKTLSINGVNFTPLPIPGTVWEDTEIVQWYMGELHQDKKYEVAAAAEDDDATVEYGVIETLNEEMIFSVDDEFAFNDGDYLGIKITAINGQNVSFYKIKINFQLTTIIKFGTPEFIDGKFNINDSVWDGLDELQIKKPAPESSFAEFNRNPDTFGAAKVLWDDDGLYVYVKVTDPNVTSTAATGNFHEADSVEVFINENYTNANSGSYNNRGGQYRIGANGELSADPAAAETVLKTLNSYAEKTSDGYIVIFQVPWRFKENFPLADNKNIGLEIQINACGESPGSRYGVVVWNNTRSQSYQNVSHYGLATLDLGNNTLRVEAKKPQITKQPIGASYSEDVTIDEMAELSVEANVDDAGELSYQWYKASSSAYDGDAISGAVDSAYQPVDTDEGIYWYYVVITNTLPTAALGYQTAETFSASVKISIGGDGHESGVDANGNPYFIVGLEGKMVKNTEPIPSQYGGFNIKLDLPDSFDISDYARVTIRVRNTRENGTEIGGWITGGIFFLNWVDESTNPLYPDPDNEDRLGSFNNLSMMPQNGVLLPATFNGRTPVGLRLEKSDAVGANNTAFIELLELKFHN